MLKNKLSLTVKLFISVWIVLLLHVLLKVTFNYWQPYVIPNEQLQYISDYIDNHRWLQATLNGIFYTISGIIIILCGLQKWWFSNKKQSMIVISLIILSFIYSLVFNETILNTIALTIVVPLIIDKKKFITILSSFALSILFLFLSLLLEGFANSDDMPYIIGTFLNIDYYIMLILNYFAFNLIRKKESKNG